MSTRHSAERRSLLTRLARLSLAGGACLTTGAFAVPASSDPLQRAAPQTPRALAAFLLDVAAAGSRLVAVGERGTVLLSDDAGKQWRQVACPVSVTLTAVSFPAPKLGWAVGHGGVVLHSADAGLTWTRQLDGHQAAQIELDAARAAGDAARVKRAEQLQKDGADKPLLGLHFDEDGRRGLVVGAYGLAFATEDGGLTWQSWMGRTRNPRGLHLNAVYVTGAGASTIYLAGEQGLLLRSSDAGRQFARLTSPYEGSWFALTGIGDDVVVVAGLRGNAWWTGDHGASFVQSAVQVPVSFSAATRTREGELLIVNQAGMVLASNDRGRSFRVLPQPPGPPATQVAQAADGTLVASTMSGPVRLPPAPVLPKR